MAALTTNMGLTVWNIEDDHFNHDELANNFYLLDNHDHSNTKGAQIPTGGILDNAVTIDKMAAQSVGATQLVDGSVTPTKLGSNTMTTRKFIVSGEVKITNALTSTSPYGIGGGNAILTGTNQANVLSVGQLIAADYTVGGINSLLSLRAVLATNATAPAVTITAGFFPVTAVAGTATNLSYTIGTAVTGSTVSWASPAASFLDGKTASDFAFPADGFYVLGFTLSATPAANNVTGLRIGLSYKHS